MIGNLRSRISEYSFRQLLGRFAEEYVWWVLRNLPGLGGVLLRYLFLKCWAARVDGFCWISQGCTIVNTFGLRVGRNFATNRNVLIDAMGGIEIGDDSGIGPNCVLIAQEHTMLSDDYFRESSLRRKPIRIGSEVWIGSNCFIKSGVTIGDRAVIGACSNVIADVPANGRVIGSPARPYTQVLREYLRGSRAAPPRA